MIGRDDDRKLPLADSLIQILNHVRNQRIGTHGDVDHFMRVWPPGMANEIVR